MFYDPRVIAALAVAVERDPHNTVLRLHLATMLLGAGQPANALEHCSWVLTRQPDHQEALRLAAESARNAGDETRARGYQRLYEALEKGQTEPPPYFPDLSKPPFPELAESFSPGDVMPLPLDAANEQNQETQAPLVTLADVAGMEETKRRLNRSFLAPMKNPDIRKLQGASSGNGLLLYGPPGCGKTFIARAMAGELGARFVSIGPSAILSMWLGHSEHTLNDVFQTARRSGPCVLFFDEIEALGRKRTPVRESAGQDVGNQLLAELDRLDSSRDGVFVLAATSQPWEVDTALRGPGRLDRTLLILPPDIPARAAILRRHARERPLENVDFMALAAKTSGFSGADLAQLIESATTQAMEDSLARGSARPLRVSDFQSALKTIQPSTRAWFGTVRNYALFANEGGIYDDLLAYLRNQRLL